MLDSIFSKLDDIKKFENFVTNTTCDNFERTLYFNDKHYIKTNLVLCADGKNSQLRKLLLIKTILKTTGHITTSADGTYNIGSNGSRFATGYFDAVGVTTSAEVYNDRSDFIHDSCSDDDMSFTFDNDNMLSYNISKKLEQKPNPIEDIYNDFKDDDSFSPFDSDYNMLVSKRCGPDGLSDVSVSVSPIKGLYRLNRM